MHQIHPNARTTPAVRAAVAASAEPSRVLATRDGVSTETLIVPQRCPWSERRRVFAGHGNY